MSNLSGAASRVGSLLQGLFVGGIAMMFVVAGAAIVYGTNGT
jgi:hypothetical protein